MKLPKWNLPSYHPNNSYIISKVFLLTDLDLHASTRSILVLIIILSFIAYEGTHVSPIDAQNTINRNTSPISIYRDTYSSSSLIHIVISAPDFNSNSYAIDTIGDDSNGRITVSTRESSIPYRLVETGPDTGLFTGYVILSGMTSTCSPVCGPTDGFLMASGDDAITVSFTYAQGKTITSTSADVISDKNNSHAIPEFDSAVGLVTTISIIGSMVYSIMWNKRA